MIFKKETLELIGQTFFRLKILSIERRDNGNYAVCQCLCGKQKCISVAKIRSQNTKSCGCLNKELASERAKANLIGRQFGSLQVKSEAGVDKKQSVLWNCTCSCGNKTIVTTRNLKIGNTSSCGCKKRRRGSSHPNWKDSISEEDRVNKRGIVKNPKYGDWRTAVFARDNFTCQLTGRTGRLTAHHIYSWNTHPDKRFSLENGITLHEDIHRLFHKIFGNGNNTPEQFSEFKNLLTKQ